tara:strand:+ start:2190 stop:2582 length:393 start_codon:yes stop_codon:yes gene_type:complete
MSEEFKLDIVNPEKLFVSKNDVIEVVAPSLEGEMGILKDHIPIISFLKPGILKIISKNNNEESYFIEDGILEFKDNSLSILTSTIFDLKNSDKNYITNSLKDAEKQLEKSDIDDQKRFLLSQKVETLRQI